MTNTNLFYFFCALLTSTILMYSIRTTSKPDTRAFVEPVHTYLYNTKYQPELLMYSDVSGTTVIAFANSNYSLFNLIITNSTIISFSEISNLILTNQVPTFELRITISDQTLDVQLPTDVYYPKAINMTSTNTVTKHYLAIRPYATNDIIVTEWLKRLE